VDFYSQPIAGPVNVTNRHCTGQGLTAFYECIVSPGSITSHDITLNADGSITFANAPASYTGIWFQQLDDRLTFVYYDAGQLVAAFRGTGVGGDCFEGITLFPGSAYNSAYEVCIH
jgi:hypothetical protein